MKTWFPLLMGGLSGTAVMTSFLLIPRWMEWGKIDVIRAVGALMTGRRERIFGSGLVLHLGMGILFAFLYAGFLNLSHLPFNTMTGLLLGSLHGVIIMLLVSIMIMEHHPVAGYHEKGLETGLAQLAAHMIYGATVREWNECLLSARCNVSTVDATCLPASGGALTGHDCA